jgi:ribose 5-phosphate isomerase B
LDYPTRQEGLEAVSDGYGPRYPDLRHGNRHVVANQFEVRAALCHDHFTAQMSRQHNDANVLVMGERVIGRGVACEILTTWLETEFEGGRHQLRLNKIQDIEKTLKG